jgi:hypothetical protein
MVIVRWQFGQSSRIGSASPGLEVRSKSQLAIGDCQFANPRTRRRQRINTHGPALLSRPEEKQSSQLTSLIPSDSS